MTSSFIYIRENDYFDSCGLVKVGRTNNLLKRDQYYITGEINRGKFGIVFEIFNEEVSRVERKIQLHFKDLNIRKDAGTEFFKREIKEKIEIFFKENRIQYKKLTEEEIEEEMKKVVPFPKIETDNSIFKSEKNISKSEMDDPILGIKIRKKLPEIENFYSLLE